MPTFQPVPYARRLSTYVLNAVQGLRGALINDLALPLGAVNRDNLFGASGTGTTSATVGDTTAITHNLGVVPPVGGILITPTSNGVVYLDPANPPTATTFNVLGSAASLSFQWAILANGPGNQSVAQPAP